MTRTRDSAGSCLPFSAVGGFLLGVRAAVLHGACAAGLGVALLPEFLCRQGLATGRLKLVLPDWTLAPAAILYAVYATTLEADTRVQRFVEFLAANIIPALASARPSQAFSTQRSS